MLGANLLSKVNTQKKEKKKEKRKGKDYSSDVFYP